MRTDPKCANTVLLGTGVVGGAFLGIVRGERPPEGLALRGIVNRRGHVPVDLLKGTIDDGAIAELVARPAGAAEGAFPDAWLDALAALPNAVLVDATAADGMEPLYLRALRARIHVVTANKKPLTCPWSLRSEIDEAASGGARLRYEATVGAGLPVIETLKDLVRTGDRVRRIDCVLSGTLGFVCDELRRGQPLSRIMAVARERGYTEPDWRDDLGGADVARKSVILAREIGGQIEVGDVELEPFVPRSILDAADVSDLERSLAPIDGALTRRIERLTARGETLVYLARIERKDDRVIATAGPVAVRADHPAAALRGSRAMVAFTTDRYADEPLVVSGSGAGGPVTAAALVADALKAAGI